MRISDWSSDVCSSDLSASLLAMIPHAAIAGLLILVAWNLLELPRWRHAARVQRSECMIALATLVATVTIRMEIAIRSEEHTSELQSLMRISYAVFCLKKKNETTE